MKEPWRSSWNTPLAEMLVINNRMDKMQWAEADFQHCGMLTGLPTLGVSAEFTIQADLYATELTSSLSWLAANPDGDNDRGSVDGNGLSRTRLAEKHTSSITNRATKAAKASLEEHVPQKLESSLEPKLHLLSATEIQILGLEEDLKRAWHNFTELSQRHSKLIDKQSEELSMMERQVLDKEVKKIITTARC
ncbi:hypothetical protein AAF712_016307 [Marasmius tenuissimus]|uniref:Uncharacterized protein n=1 Tax=Marasmius tenuissimus TaxID=585030 RepID=A0ABR2Z712_9AGAR